MKTNKRIIILFLIAVIIIGSFAILAINAETTSTKTLYRYREKIESISRLPLDESWTLISKTSSKQRLGSIANIEPEKLDELQEKYSEEYYYIKTIEDGKVYKYTTRPNGLGYAYYFDKTLPTYGMYDESQINYSEHPTTGIKLYYSGSCSTYTLIIYTKYEFKYWKWSEWSAWSETPCEPSETIEVETKESDILYRFREKDFTTSNVKLDSPWVLYDTSYEYNHEGETVSYYPYSSNFSTSRCVHKIEDAYIYEYNGHSFYATEAEFSKMYSMAVSHGTGSTIVYYKPISRCIKVTTCQFKTIKRSTYYYYKWSDWSQWSFTPVEASDDIEVETKISTRFDITYNANGGIGAPSSTTKEFDETITLSTIVPTKENHQFLGWSTYLNGNVEYTPGGEYSANADVIFYAVWKNTTQYTISYNANGGTNAPLQQIKLHDESISISSEIPTREGSAFLGWSTTASGEVEYNIGATYEVNESITLFAVWYKNEYIISYDGNGGSGAPDYQIKTHDDDLVLSSLTPIRAGYAFLGWSTERGGVVEYLPSDHYTENIGTTLYAVWKADTYTVIYDANGGEGAPTPQTKIHDVALTLSGTMPTHIRYTFAGWSTTVDGSVCYEPGCIYSENADLFLYAIWKEKTNIVDYGICGDNLTWTLFDDGLLLISGTGAMYDWSDCVQTPWWSYRTQIETVMIEEGCTTIGSQAFATLSGITPYAIAIAILPNTLEAINSGAFYMCASITEIAIPDNVKAIGASAFYECSNLKIVSFGETLNTIDSYAFWACKSLTKLELNTKLETIGWYAFTGCDSVGTIDIQENLKTIGIGAFNSCDNLQRITVHPDNTYYTNDDNGVLYDALNHILIQYPNGSLTTSYVIDNTTVNIARSAFSNCNNLHEVYLPKSLSIIDAYNFVNGVRQQIQTIYYAGTSVEWEKNITVKAQDSSGLYSPMSYDVIFNNGADEYVIQYNNNGSNWLESIENQIKIQDIDLTLSNQKFQRTGYKFLGWSTSKNGEVEYLPNSIYSKNESVTLYAVWAELPKELKINSNNSITFSIDEKATKLYTYTPTNSGMYLMCSHDSMDTIIKLYDDDGVILKSVDSEENSYTFQIEYYLLANNKYYIEIIKDNPNWSATIDFVFEELYTVSYDMNGGNGNIQSQVKYYNVDLILSNIVPTRSGYDFMGWSTTDSNTTEYLSEETYSKNESVTLYAVWKSHEHQWDSNTLCLNLDDEYHNITCVCGESKLACHSWNTGEVTFESTHINFGTRTYTCDDCSATRTEQIATITEHSYGAWTKIDDINHVRTCICDHVETQTHQWDDGEITLYPTITTTGKKVYTCSDCYATKNETLAKIQSYSVTYDANGGLNTPSAQIKTYDVDLTLTNSTPNRTGYTFMGWATSASGSVVYSAGDTFTVNEDTTLYAVWKINKYIVTFDANGGINVPAAQTKTHDVSLILTTDEPTRDGYTFAGWATSAAGALQYKPGDVFDLEGDITLYAVWESDKYIVTFNANGGSDSPDSQEKFHDIPLILSAEIPNRYGYTFKGWSNTASGTVVYAPGAYLEINSDITLYAVWEANRYTVTFNANGGTNEPDDQVKIFGIELVLSSIEPVRDGYIFKGWQGSDGNVYNVGDTYVENTNLTLTAVWEIITYTVTFDRNGGVNGITSQIKTYGMDMIISSNSPTRTGYTFKGWATEKDGFVVYSSGDVYSNDASITLYAVWEIKTYTVSYMANGGSGAPNSQVKTHGSDLTLDSDVPTKTGHIFYGWSTTKDGAVVYLPGAVYSNNSSLILYAVWELETYNITYDANGGSGAPSSQTKTYGVDLELRSTIPTRTGYNFYGWATTSDGSVSYVAGGIYATDADVTLYAVWDAKTTTVSYDANGGTGAPEKQTKTYDVDLKLSNVRPTRDGYDFNGWALSSNGAVVYAPGDIYSTEANATLYAVWEAHTYTVTFDVCGGLGTPESQTKVHDIDLIITDELPSRAGYIFKGWSVSENGIISYKSNSVYTENNSITLYAVWEIITFTVSYNANGGTSAPESQIKEYDSDITITDSKPTRIGYTFIGWSSESSGSVEYVAGNVYSDNSDITMYAVWVINTYSIKYDANGGINAPITQIKKHGVNLNICNETPTRSGHIFKGWSTSNDGDVTYVAGNTYSLDEDITLYAIWEAETYTVSYDANGGIGAPGTQLKTYDCNLILSEDQPKRKGYSFKGWSTMPDGEAIYSPGDEYVENEDITLYAVWEEIEVNYGDTNGDSKIDTRDAVLLAQHLAGWNVTIDTKASDCNADGKIDTRDAVLLAQYLAGWNVTLG